MHHPLKLFALICAAEEALAIDQMHRARSWDVVGLLRETDATHGRLEAPTVLRTDSDCQRVRTKFSLEAPLIVKIGKCQYAPKVVFSSIWRLCYSGGVEELWQRVHTSQS